MAFKRRWAGALWPLLMSGCDVVGVVDCPAWIPPAVIAEVTDSVTGEWVAEGAVGFARKTGVELPLEVYAHEVVDGVAVATSLAPQGGPAGVYEVEISRAGYQAWSRGGVVVTEHVCSVKTAELLARLRPDSPPPPDPCFPGHDGGAPGRN